MASRASAAARTTRLTALAEPEPEPEPEPISLAAFRSLFRDGRAEAAATEGSLGASGLRSVAWKWFLGVLPRSPDRWSDSIIAQRAAYSELKRKWLPDPDAAEDMDPTLNNPLCPVDDSPWAKVRAPWRGAGRRVVPVLAAAHAHARALVVASACAALRPCRLIRSARFATW